ncbi:hypothetical protein ACFO5Q_09575 [Kordiimonas lipolytica]|uniref:ATP/GTP-binding protein n=1 Tax=Kordiimonas lipolytica TaxID=1662421 RepID=A0ABV8UAB2_9PROT|nr:hypothetical protein [Kordiimonas lipolytica]
MYKALIAAITAITVSIGAAPLAAETAHIREIWSINEGLFEPESVAVDEARNYVYASNVVGYGINGKGYISRMSMSGRMIEAKWIEGLNGPTGLALSGTLLYVADVNSLKALNVETGDIVATYPAPDREPCLNDVALAADGTVFVSGSCTGTIYKLDGDKLTRFIVDHEALRFVNGLFVDGELLLSGGWQIRLWNRFSGAPLADGPVTRQPDVKDIDGLAWDGSAFLMSMVDDPRLWRLKADGVAYPISDQPFHASDFYYDDVTGLLIMPRNLGEGDHRVTAYRLTFE